MGGCKSGREPRSIPLTRLRHWTRDNVENTLPEDAPAKRFASARARFEALDKVAAEAKAVAKASEDARELKRLQEERIKFWAEEDAKLKAENDDFSLPTMASL